MFESIASYISRAFTSLTEKGSITQRDVDETLREVERALIEADVNRTVIAEMMQKVRDKALDETLIRSITPGQQVVKIVYDEILVNLSGEPSDPKGPRKRKTLAEELYRNHSGTTIYLFVGLQGSGKTTTLAKVAQALVKEKKRVLTASLDVYRPAAQHQLDVLSNQAGADCLSVIPEQNKPPLILKRALQEARLKGYDFLLLDTAGRLHVDERLLAELAQVHRFSQPHETLLVVDSLTGQSAVQVATAFKNSIGVTGFVLTRLDGDGRGGAALSIRATTGVPIKLLGIGEKLDDLEVFNAEAISGRILGMGGVVDLVVKMQDVIKKEDIDRMGNRLKKGVFDLNDMAAQIDHMSSLGGMKNIINMMNVNLKQQLEQMEDFLTYTDERMMRHDRAIIRSMTKKERSYPDILNASRRRRIAAGAGVSITDVNRLLKMHKKIADMYKRMSKSSGGTTVGMLNFFKSMGSGKGLMSMLGAGSPDINSFMPPQDEQDSTKNPPSSVDPNPTKEILSRMCMDEDKPHNGKSFFGPKV